MIKTRYVACKVFADVAGAGWVSVICSCSQAARAPVDRGVRGGAPGAGSALKGLTADENAFFQDGLVRFSQIESVTGGQNNGLGPRFNSNSCLSCHVQPSVGGSSPATNPSIAIATLNGAKNVVPWFIAQHGPIRAASLTRSPNDATITRFGWKAQNKSFLMFASEAYNVEMGVTNQLFPQERDETAGCVFNPTPEDTLNFTPAATSTPKQNTGVVSDIEAFADFMRMLAPPTPAPDTPSVVNGRAVFAAVGCALFPSHSSPTRTS